MPADDPAVGGTVIEPTDPATQISLFGAIGVYQTTQENNVVNGQPTPGVETGATASAVLSRLAEPFTLEEYGQGVLASQDTCTRYEQGIPVEGHLAGEEVVPPEILDGGDVLTIDSPQGTYMALAREQIATGPAYTTSELILPLPVPADLVAYIPGAEFPAVGDIGIPEIDPLVVLDETPQNILNPTFSWVVGTSAATIVVLSAGTNSANGMSSHFICTAIDDGEFTAPDWAVSAFDDSAIAKTRTLIRSVDELTVEGSTLVVGSSYSSYTSVASQ